ncbi:MAG: cytochrome c maturation protein CcmE [Gammaproteobacteria bacterium]|nr:cytochrome c maturation protein CcmE [Gammaproteobacteria bacterium]MBI5615213.1 cytochrome c maturation protein CcmE [Gammaproteobacteria bacterium]
MTPRQRRLWAVVLVLIGMGIATALILTAFNKNLMYFYSPSQISAGEAPQERPFRVGGLVVRGSVKRAPNSLAVHFTLTDTIKNVDVTFDGILPDLFREGQGIVANGKLGGDGVFVASEVLAKHDENYMPPEVAAALKKSNPNYRHNGAAP